jgi:hypothetical protein
VIREGHGAVGRDESLRVFEVLHSQGNALEWPRPTTGDALLRRARVGEQLVPVAQRDEGVERGRGLVDAREGRLHDLDGRDRTGGQVGDEFADGAAKEIGHALPPVDGV